jgi:predicted hotdog family 3-hydroxylacyl-ACP dehydratase
MPDSTIPHKIEDLIPHRGSMLLLDEILMIDTEAAVSKARVKKTWPLFDGSKVSSLVLVELVAQTCGLSNGLGRIRDQGIDSEKKGFLVGIKSAAFHVKSLAVGTLITTEARNRFEFDSFREVAGIAKAGEELLGEVTLQVIQAGT